MKAERMDGKKVALTIRNGLRNEIASLKDMGIHPGLATVLVGSNLVSRKYIALKEKACAELGIKSFSLNLPGEISQGELIALIDGLNADPKVQGILVQLPLPKHLNEKHIMQRIEPCKDVDGFGPHSLGKLIQDEPLFIPCTPHGVLKMLDDYGIDPAGKYAVVVGRSIIVGKPLALLLLQRNATVTICHSKTQDLKAQCLKADILCIAIGKAKYIKGNMIKKGAVVIDIGINITPEGKLVGDVDFESACSKARYISPVPGGVGPMTIAMLMSNTVLAAKMQGRINIK